MGLKMKPVPGKLKSTTLCAAFIEGAKASMSAAEWERTKGAVFFGVKAGNEHDWSQALFRLKHFGEPYYVVDNAYLDPTRGTHFRVTRNMLQIPGFGPTDGKRFEATGLEVKPWRNWNDGGYTLVVHQSEDHMVRMAREPKWIDTNLRRLTEGGIKEFRHRRWSADKLKLQATLAEDLAGAQAVLTHTSAAAVMAVLAGVPAVCSTQSAAYAMTGVPEADRRRWAGVLADNQFTMDELKDGTAWRKITSR